MNSGTTDRAMMARAMDEARAAGAAGETPVGAVIVDAAGEVVASAGNAPIATHDPSGHAEIRALRMAGARLGNYRLPETTLFVTLEPCAMCAGAISHRAREARLVIAARQIPKGGAVWHGPKLLRAAHLPLAARMSSKRALSPMKRASDLLKDFFPRPALRFLSLTGGSHEPDFLKAVRADNRGERFRGDLTVLLTVNAFNDFRRLILDAAAATLDNISDPAQT